jgi:hypothetical protein
MSPEFQDFAARVEEKHLIIAKVFPFIAGFFATMLLYN